MKKHTSSFKQAGDTIIEVIIAIAVISTILSGAFLVTTHSTRAVRDSEEHAEALQYLQGQVELLRAAASHTGGLPSTINVPFCLSSGQYYQPAANSAQCTIGSFYSVSIVSPSSSPAVNATTTFKLTASWAALSGGTDTVYLAYKVVVTP
jgi:prepilin-type N-terminal cleavage/methylation domain-containing protein